jgi:hypothetical protein
MDTSAPSTRSPQALRGATLRIALGELGIAPETPVAASAVVARSVPAPVFPTFVAPVEGEDDDEPPPRALRPEELARLVQEARDRP